MKKGKINRRHILLIIFLFVTLYVAKFIFESYPVNPDYERFKGSIELAGPHYYFKSGYFPHSEPHIQTYKVDDIFDAKPVDKGVEIRFNLRKVASIELSENDKLILTLNKVDKSIIDPYPGLSLQFHNPSFKSPLDSGIADWVRDRNGNWRLDKEFSRTLKMIKENDISINMYYGTNGKYADPNIFYIHIEKYPEEFYANSPNLFGEKKSMSWNLNLTINDKKYLIADKMIAQTYKLKLH